MIYSSVIDYYLEPKIAYYFLRRACPVPAPQCFGTSATGAMVRLRATVGTETEPAQVQVRFYREGQWRSVDMQATGRRQYEANVPATDGD
jgi:hypothetical protein